MPQIPLQPVLSTVVGLAGLAAALLILPFRVRKIEKNLEPFFLAVGVVSVTVSGLWRWPVIIEALKAPIMIGAVPIGIVQVVLVMGLLIHYANAPFSRWILRLARKLGHRLFLFLLIAAFGLLSSILSVIVTAVLVAEIAVALPLSGKERKNLVVITCFAAGLGACLSPLGEPLSAILVSKLAGPPYHAGFFFPLKYFGFLMIPAVLALALLGALWIGPRISPFARGVHTHDPETAKTVVLAAGRLKISMKEWAAVGLPLGLTMMAVYFFILYVF